MKLPEIVKDQLDNLHAGCLVWIYGGNQEDTHAVLYADPEGSGRIAVEYPPCFAHALFENDGETPCQSEWRVLAVSDIYEFRKVVLSFIRGE